MLGIPPAHRLLFVRNTSMKEKWPPTAHNILFFKMKNCETRDVQCEWGWGWGSSNSFLFLFYLIIIPFLEQTPIFSISRCRKYRLPCRTTFFFIFPPYKIRVPKLLFLLKSEPCFLWFLIPTGYGMFIINPSFIPFFNTLSFPDLIYKILF